MYVIVHFWNINFINHVTTSLTTKLESVNHLLNPLQNISESEPKKLMYLNQMHMIDAL